MLSSCNFWTEATALFLPTSFSEKMKLLDKSHNSTVPSSCKVTDLTPARMRFFATGNKENIEINSSKINNYKTNTKIIKPARMRIKSYIFRHRKKEGQITYQPFEKIKDNYSKKKKSYIRCIQEHEALPLF